MQGEPILQTRHFVLCADLACILLKEESMTKIAIPHWQGRVSPVYDVAERVLLADIVSGNIIRQGELLIGVDDPQSRSLLLASAGIEVLICGAISCPFELAVKAAGITLISQICGDIDLILRAYAAGRLAYYRMPGCRGRRGQGHCGRGRAGKFKL